MFRLSNLDVKMDILSFTCCIVTHYLKLAKLKKQIPPNIIYPEKHSWKYTAAVVVNKRTQGQHYLKVCLQKRWQVCLKKPTTHCPICKVGLCVEPFYCCMLSLCMKDVFYKLEKYHLLKDILFSSLKCPLSHTSDIMK